MLGLKNLPMNRLTTAYMVVSAAMIVFALALAPADSAALTSFVLWILGALILIGVWVAVGVEISKRFFGGSFGGSAGRDGNTGNGEEHNSPV